MFSLISKLLFVASLLSNGFQPHSEQHKYEPKAQYSTSKDEDFVKSACQIWWGLPMMKTTSPKDMQAWAKKVMPTMGKALSKAAEAKKLNSKWSQFQLEMVTFYGSIYLGTDITYSRTMFTTTIEKNAINYLSSICAKRH